MAGKSRPPGEATRGRSLEQRRGTEEGAGRERQTISQTRHFPYYKIRRRVTQRRGGAELGSPSLLGRWRPAGGGGGGV